MRTQSKWVLYLVPLVSVCVCVCYIMCLCVYPLSVKMYGVLSTSFVAFYVVQVHLCYHASKLYCRVTLATLLFPIVLSTDHATTRANACKALSAIKAHACVLRTHSVGTVDSVQRTELVQVLCL